jgi:putative redox protein
MRTVRVASRPGTTYGVTISDGRHELIADAAEVDGGEQAGPTPYELLIGALGACMVITIEMYARRKSWPLEGVEIDLTHEKVFAADCDYCTQEEIDEAGPQGRIDVITTQISLQGRLDNAQIARLREIGHRCPVHRTVASGAKIVEAGERATPD